MNYIQEKQIKILLLSPSAGISSLFRPESRTGFSRDRWAVPPIGLYRIKGYLQEYGVIVEIFDSCISTEESLISKVKSGNFSIIGFSITHQTLENDIYFMCLCKKYSPSSKLIIGGDEATFNYQQVMDIAPIDFAILGEGERPLKEICNKLKTGNLSFEEIPGIVYKSNGQYNITGPNHAMNQTEFEKNTLSINYAEIPYEKYWEKIESFYKNPNVDEIRTIRLFTSNYCPMKCTFCSSTNFLDAAGSNSVKKKTPVVSLSGESLINILLKAIQNHPTVRTIFINDDNFMFQTKRVNDFCDRVYKYKQNGEIPDHLKFLCLSRTDTLNRITLKKMSAAGFHLIGFGIESFSQQILNDLNKKVMVNQIHKIITDTLDFKLRPYMNIILFPPSSSLDDIYETIDYCLNYIEKGVEVAIEPFMIPLPGASITNEGYDIFYEDITIAGTGKVLKLATIILPRDRMVRNLVLKYKDQYNVCLDFLTKKFQITHIPARFRSLVSIYTFFSQLTGYENKLNQIENIINAQFFSTDCK